jgi:uncharacterized protein (DUF885 family)
LESTANLVAYLDAVALELLRQSPEAITTRGLATQLGVRNDALDSLVLDVTGASYAPLERALERIESTDLSQEDPERRRQVEAFARWLEIALDGRPFQQSICLVSTYITSYPQRLAWFMTHIHPLRTPADAEDYIARLAQIPTRFDELTTRLAQSEAHRALAPRFLLARAADEIEAIGLGAAGQPNLLGHFAAGLGNMPDLDAGARQALTDQVVTLIANVVSPAYVSLAARLRELASRAPDDVGIWRLDDGAEYYAYLLRAYTTTDMTADEIYDLGLREVARLQGEVRAAAATLGYDPDLPLVDLFDQLRVHSGVVSGESAVQACRKQLVEVADLVRRAFVDWPDSLPVVEAGGDIAYFVEGAQDGSRPGAFYVPVDQTRPAYSLRTLVCHETIPGHSLQMATARVSNLPAFLDGVAFSAFTEGWATYAERLVWELGAYEDDPYGNLGRLQEELFRAARLVVDPGIHVKHWTYAQAVNYMMEMTGLVEDTVRDEVERYIVAPGQAVAYTVGLCRILELRDRACAALGPAFDLAQFHDVILAYGSVPLPVLEEIVDEFIATQRRAP